MDKNEKTINTFVGIISDVGNNTGQFSMNVVLESGGYNGEAEGFEPEGIDSVGFCETPAVKNGKTGIEGELLISKIDDVDLQLDEVGSLLVSGKDSEKYEINENGELIYNY